MLQLKELINEEQLANICLILVALSNDEVNYFEGVAGQIVTAKAVNLLIESGQNDFTDEDITKKVESMILNKILETFTSNDLLDVDLSGDEPMYRITEKGIDYVENIRKQE